MQIARAKQDLAQTSQLLPDIESVCNNYQGLGELIHAQSHFVLDSTDNRPSSIRRSSCDGTGRN
jgi:hypothetical protein